MSGKNCSLMVLALIICSVMLSGCSTTDATVETTGNENTLVVADLWDFKTIDPAESGTMISEKANVVETLVGANPDFSLKPNLATSWEMLDNNTWEFKLRENVYFHDGTLMTADAVKFSLERVLEVNPRIESMLMIDSIEIIDDNTLHIRTSTTNLILPEALQYSATSVLSRNSVDADGNFVKPIGTGSFQYESLDDKTHVLTVVKYDNWWGGEAKLDKIVLQSIRDPNTRAIAMESGKIDFTVDVPFSETDRISDLEGINVEKCIQARIYKLDVNLDNPALEDVRVRQAISYAIDRSAIADHVLYGLGSPAAGPFLPSMVWTNKDLKPYQQDLEKADQLLTEAGWVDTDGDGVREKNGVPLELDLMTYSSRPGLPLIAETVAAQLDVVGISATPEVLDWGAILDKQDNGDWDLSLSSYGTARVPAPDYVMINWFSTNGSDNGPGYSNAKVDALIEEARATKDSELRYSLYNEVEEIVYEEQPMIFVAYYGFSVVKKDSVKGYEYDPTSHDYRISADVYLEN